MKTRKPSWRKT